MSQQQSKVATAAIVRVLDADNKAKEKAHVEAAASQVLGQAIAIAESFTIRMIGSQDNVEASVNFFATAASMTDSDSTTRAYLGEDTDASGKVHKWGTNESYVRTADRNPAADATIYASDGTTDTGKTVASLTYPTEGYIWVDSTCPWKEWDETAQKYKAKVYVNVLYLGGEEVTV